MKNLHKIFNTTYTDAQKAYQIFWGQRVRFKRNDPEFFSHYSPLGWYDEHLSESTIDLFLFQSWHKKGKPEPNYSQMSFIE